jgi:hypothetical protein
MGRRGARRPLPACAVRSVQTHCGRGRQGFPVLVSGSCICSHFNHDHDAMIDHQGRCASRCNCKDHDGDLYLKGLPVLWSRKLQSLRASDCRQVGGGIPTNACDLYLIGRIIVPRRAVSTDSKGLAGPGLNHATRLIHALRLGE